MISSHSSTGATAPKMLNVKQNIKIVFNIIIESILGFRYSISSHLGVIFQEKSNKITYMNKNELRNLLKDHFVDIKQKKLEEKYLLEILWSIISLHKPPCIGLYAAINHEIDLRSIFKKCQELGIAIAYPRISDDVMTFHVIDSPEMLRIKTLGILEPDQTTPLVVPDLVVVPGLAFTKDGKRLGRGKGHYDRYLTQYNPHTVSLAFSWALLEDIPTEPHDVYINKVIWQS
jgi:5-formyltetrahydrofolate cyclo-ligase